MTPWAVQDWRRRFPDQTKGRSDDEIAAAILQANAGFEHLYPELTRFRDREADRRDRASGAAYGRKQVENTLKLAQRAEKSDQKGFFSTYLKDPNRRGVLMSKQADIIMATLGPDDTLTREEVQQLVKIRKEMQEIEASDHFKEFQESTGFWNGWGEFWGWKETPAILAEVTNESLSAMLHHGWAKITGGAAAGAGTALALGQAGPQVGLPEELITVPTAALWGGATGMGKTSYNLSASSKYLEVIAATVGDDVMDNPDLLFDALNNPAKMKEARSKAQKYGIPIALFDTLSMGLAGRATAVGTKVATAAGSRAAAKVGQEGMLNNAARLGLLGTEKAASTTVPMGFR